MTGGTVIASHHPPCSATNAPNQIESHHDQHPTIVQGLGMEDECAISLTSSDPSEHKCHPYHLRNHHAFLFLRWGSPCKKPPARNASSSSQRSSEMRPSSLGSKIRELGSTYGDFARAFPLHHITLRILLRSEYLRKSIDKLSKSFLQHE